MIFRFLILGLLAYLVLMLIYSSIRRKGRSTDPSQGESMVLDPHCKSYVPRTRPTHHTGTTSVVRNAPARTGPSRRETVCVAGRPRSYA